MLPEKKSRYLLHKYGVLYTEYTFDRFNKTFLGDVSKETVQNWHLLPDVQEGEKYLLKMLHNQRLVELYNIYYERAKDDTNAFKAFTEFSKTFFSDNDEGELTKIIRGLDVGDYDE